MVRRNIAGALAQGLRALMLGVLLLSASWPMPAAARGNNNRAEGAVLSPVAGVPQQVRLTVGKAEVFNLPRGAADVLVSNPAVADVSLPSPKRLYLMGTGTGDCNIFVFDKAGSVIARLEVQVRVDEASLKETLGAVLPNEIFDVKTVNRDVYLSGSVSSPAAAEKARMIARRFVTDDQNLVDLLSVMGDQQVLIRVRVLEAQKSAIQALGVEPNVASDSINSVLSAGLSTAAGMGLSTAPFATGTLMYSPNGFGPLSLIVRALEDKGLATVLAEPNLTAVSGETASFLAGGEFPIPVSQDQTGAITIEFRQFGVSLAFTPTVLDQDRISMRLGTEVSSLSNQGQITLNSTVIPALAVRRAETTVEMGSGGSLMIAGLLQSRDAKSFTGLPGVSKLPIIGDLMSSREFQHEQTELVIVVSAVLVKPHGEPIATKSPIILSGERAVGGIALRSSLSTLYPALAPRLPQAAKAGYRLD